MKYLVIPILTLKTKKLAGTRAVEKLFRKPARLGINLLDWLYDRGFAWLANLLVPLVGILKLISMPVYSIETDEDVDNFWKERGWTSEPEEEVLLAKSDEFPF